MQITYTSDAKSHLDFWIKSGNKIIIKRILQITQSIIETPFDGIGKPEALKYELTGFWSRRINSEHRFVYKIEENSLFIFSLKGHY